MIIEHIVRSVDSMQSIASLYLDDATRWREIADFNNLDYPYITADPTFEKNVRASGIVRVTRLYNSSSLLVPKGTKFSVPALDDLLPRVYESTRDITIALGDYVGDIPVQCTVPGLWGNVTANSITQVDNTSVLQSAFSAITNPAAFTNGAIRNVRVIGDPVLISVATTESDGEQVYEDVTDFYNRYFGGDLALGDDGELQFDGYGDIGSVVGIGNLVQSVRDRLVTPKLSLVYHPEYGSVLGQITGQGVTPYTRKWISLAIKETLLMDDRIRDAEVVSIDIDTSRKTVAVVVEVQPISRGQNVRVSTLLTNIASTA